jgi:hypothetical protein
MEDGYIGKYRGTRPYHILTKFIFHFLAVVISHDGITSTIVHVSTPPRYDIYGSEGNMGNIGRNSIWELMGVKYGRRRYKDWFFFEIYPSSMVPHQIPNSIVAN